MKPMFIKRDPKVNLYTVLQKRVHAHFKEKGIPLHGTWRSHIVVAIVLALFLILTILPYAITLSPVNHYISSVFLGVVIALIGFIVGHSASHGSLSKYKETNELLAYSFDLCAGVSSFFWKIKHEIVHHFFTNILKYDDDIETGGIFRFSPLQKWYPWHLIQILYMIPFYAMLYLQWIFIKDFQKLAQMKVGETKIKKIEFADIFIIFGGKVIHLLLFVFIPWVVFGFDEMIRAYMCMILTTGLIITIIFQLAHVQRKSAFLKPDQVTGSIENDWIISQIISTANFGQESFMVRLLTGGLSNQIEHHCFPEINPEHYPTVSKFIIEFCEENEIPYNSYPTVLKGFGDHVLHVINMSVKPKNLSLEN